MHPAGLRLDRWPHRRRALQTEVAAGRSEKPGTSPGGGSLLPKCRRDPLTGRKTPGERHCPTRGDAGAVRETGRPLRLRGRLAGQN
ncbi:hypothetical protein NDU88_003954 [Pleurodeles waltl]|uniref:Uncharacterized protein n=1 Tax=Pleurodeles waltl TaxID=8319 RepID=A0AAV7VHA1_PLEWA|nr:hypothetical protein NDU88_003954 [Pleurodeles waltl]